MTGCLRCPGDIPSPTERPTGCPFHTRCPDFINGICDVNPPHEVSPGAWSVGAVLASQ